MDQHADRKFVAETKSPEPLRLLLSHTGIAKSSFGSFAGLGWQLVVNKLTPTGDERPFRDHWEESFLEILRYPDNYSNETLEWRSATSGEATDLFALQPVYDASARHATAVKTASSPDGAQRLCFNLYDDGQCRFTREELVRDGKLSAWLPRQWSNGHADLAGAEHEARSAISWFR